MERKTLAPKPFPPADAPYVQGVKVRGAEALIFVSAQVARDEQGRFVGEGDPEEQTRQVIRNIERVLKEAAAGLADVVKVTVFITDISYFPAVVRARAELFGETLPASSFAVVTSLSHPEFLVAMEAIAVKGEKT
jgi:reactive intermediate/imine deaminase